MKQVSSLVRACVGAAGLLAVAMVPAALAGEQDFTLVNGTDVEIHQVFTSPHSTDDWEEDVMGDDTLPPGESVEISFSPKEDAAMWDLKVTDGDGNSITWTNLNLTEISQVTVHYKNGKAWADLK